MKLQEEKNDWKHERLHAIGDVFDFFLFLYSWL